jgi:type II secretory pathway component GspD/PulD (secretin)
LNNETAEIKITTNEAIGVRTTTTGSTGDNVNADPERQETGVSLRVTPQVNLETGYITMFIYPQVSDATTSVTITNAGKEYTFKNPEVRSSKNSVRIRDGETVIIGGLIRNQLSQTTKKVPILGDIPIIGMMFRHKYKDKDVNRELLVFITPRIVKDAYYQKTTKTAKKPLAAAREQSAPSSLINRQAVINSRLNSFEKME